MYVSRISLQIERFELLTIDDHDQYTPKFLPNIQKEKERRGRGRRRGKGRGRKGRGQRKKEVETQEGQR